MKIVDQIEEAEYIIENLHIKRLQLENELKMLDQLKQEWTKKLEMIKKKAKNEKT